MEDENVKKSNSKMQLIIIEPNQNLEYYDVSKIGFHKFDDELCVVPTENKKEYFPIAFNRSFIHQNIFQRLICIDECESDPKRYLLIFSTADKCIRFIESIKTGKVKDKLLITTSNDDEAFKMNYFSPIIKMSDEYSFLEELLKPLIVEFHEFYLPPSKNEENMAPEENFDATKDIVNESLNAVTQELLPNDDETAITKTVDKACENNDETNKVRRSLRNKSKTIRYQMDECEVAVKSLQNDTPNSVYHDTQHIENENLAADITNEVEQNIGESNENKRSLRKRPANISYQMDENEEEGIDNETSILENRSESPKKKQKCLDEIIYAPNFKYFHFLRMGDSRSRLFIFPNGDRKLCYEYFYCFHGQQYVCCGCNNKHQRTSAIINKDSNGVDYVKCERTDHICDLRKYKPEKCKSDLLIRKPNYEIIKQNIMIKGKLEMRESLLLYISTDKKKFYKLYWEQHQKMFICGKCRASNIYIQAFVHEEIVYVRNQKHVCSSMKYLDFIEASVMPNNGNWEPPQRQWIKRYKSAKKSSTMKKRQRQTKAVKPRKSKLIQTTFKTHIFKKQEDTQPSDLSIPAKPQNLVASIVQKRDKQRSKPQQPKTPRSPQNMDESKIIRKPFYREFQKNVRGKMIKKLAIFNPNDSTMCYELSWYNKYQYYHCNNCNYYCKKYVFARIIKNGSDEEYVQTGNVNHGCGYRKFVL